MINDFLTNGQRPFSVPLDLYVIVLIIWGTVTLKGRELFFGYFNCDLMYCHKMVLIYCSLVKPCIPGPRKQGTKYLWLKQSALSAGSLIQYFEVRWGI